MSSSPPPMLPWPAEDFSVYGPVEAKPVGKIQAYVARAMHRNWASIPHVTHCDDADVTEFERRRKAWNAANPNDKRTLLPALVKATVATLQAYPKFNVSLNADGSTLFWKQYFHVGIAVDVPSGLLVPVIRDCDKKGAQESGSHRAQLLVRDFIRTDRHEIPERLVQPRPYGAGAGDELVRRLGQLPKRIKTFVVSHSQAADLGRASGFFRLRFLRHDRPSRPPKPKSTAWLTSRGCC